MLNSLVKTLDFSSYYAIIKMIFIIFNLQEKGGELPMEMCMRRNAKHALGLAVALHLMLPACIVQADESAGGVHKFKPNR